MAEFAKPKGDISLENPTAASLESIVCTDELYRRPLRPPDHEKENRALVALAGALADSPSTILQTLADKVCEVLDSDSSGLRLLVRGERTSELAPRAISPRAGLCSTTMCRCYSLIGSGVIRIWVGR